MKKIIGIICLLSLARIALAGGMGYGVNGYSLYDRSNHQCTEEEVQDWKIFPNDYDDGLPVSTAYACFPQIDGSLPIIEDYRFGWTKDDNTHSLAMVAHYIDRTIKKNEELNQTTLLPKSISVVDADGEVLESYDPNEFIQKFKITPIRPMF